MGWSRIGKALVETIGEGDGVGLGVGGGEAAALVAGAGDGAAEHGAGFVVEAGCGEGLLGRLARWCVGMLGMMKVLPDGEADFAGAEAVCDVGDGAHLRDGQPADWDGEADVMEAGLGLRMDSDVAGAVNGAARFALGGRDADERERRGAFRFRRGTSPCPSCR